MPMAPSVANVGRSTVNMHIADSLSSLSMLVDYFLLY
jgi:hypothetical protein